jgi:membrane DNA delivery protein
MGNFAPAVVSVIAAVIGLAMVAVLVSKSANTSSVISSAGSALSSIIGSAVSPVTGSTSTFGSSSTGTGSIYG